MSDITLSRKQVLQLAELAAKFPDTEWFSIETDSSSGIGTQICVKFDIFKSGGVVLIILLIYVHMSTKNITLVFLSGLNFKG